MAGLDGIGVVHGYSATLVHPDAAAVRVAAAGMTPGLLDVLGIQPARGRAFGDGPEDRDAVILGWDLWQDALEADPDVLGRTVRLDGRIHTVVGVMPPDFGFPENHQAWTVLEVQDGRLLPEAEVVARLADGSDADALPPTLERGLASLPVAEGTEGPYRARARSWVRGRGEGGEAYAFLALGVLVGLLLVVCAANVSALLLVRATERVSALAVHSALGASRGQVVLHLLLESLLVSLLGGLAGLAGGYWGLGWIQENLSTHWGYYWMEMGVRPGVVLGALAAVTVAAAVAGTAPALLALRTDLRGVMGGRVGGASRTGRRLGRWFLGTQVALSTVGLVAALVLGGAVISSGDVTAALPLDRVVQGLVTPDKVRYAEPAARADLALRIREVAATVPGVSVASVSVGIPGFDNRSSRLARPDDDPDLPRPRVLWLAVDARTLDAYDVDLRAGRLLTDTDGAAGGEPVVLVNEAFVDRWLDDQPILGQRVRLDDFHDDGEWARIVGVVSNHYPDRPDLRPDRVFLPLRGADVSSFTLSARTDGDAGALAPALRRAVADVDSFLPLEQTRTLRSLFEWLQRMPRSMALFGVLGGLAGVLVASIGLYGVVAFQVRMRLRETGVRMALGAPSGRILRDVLAESLVRVVPATAVGLVLAFLIAPGFVIFTFGRPPRAPAPFLAAAVTMLLVAAAAAFLPALRASRTDPQRVLRAE
jgi:predicted permease